MESFKVPGKNEIGGNEYTNQCMYKDIVALQNEIKNATGPLKKMRDDARTVFGKVDESPAYTYFSHFSHKYPLLYLNSKKIFDQLVREQPFDTNMFQNMISTSYQVDKGKITTYEAELALGKMLAKAYLPADLYDESMKSMEDPEMKKRLEEYYKQQNEENKKPDNEKEWVKQKIN